VMGTRLNAPPINWCFDQAERLRFALRTRNL